MPELEPDQAGHDCHQRAARFGCIDHQVFDQWLTEEDAAEVHVYLRRPSGSKGASHHGGASEGSGPLRGESMLQRCKYVPPNERMMRQALFECLWLHSTEMVCIQYLCFQIDRACIEMVNPKKTPIDHANGVAAWSCMPSQVTFHLQSVPSKTNPLVTFS